MSVEANSELGVCSDCDQDCIKCMNQGYCEYEVEEGEDNDNDR